MNWEQDLSPVDHDTPNIFLYNPNRNTNNMYYDYDEDESVNLTLDDCKERFLNQTRDFQDNHTEGFCPVTFDSIVCWPPTRLNETATIQCFSELFNIKYDTTQNATRFCNANGTWWKQNFTMCKEIILMPEDPATQAGIYFVGFTLSLITLTIAVGIFMYFKDLRCLRNKIHINLMWSYILMYCTWIVMLILINYRNESIMCGFGTMLLHYSHVSTFFWMFVEGMYLYILVVKTLRREIFKLRVYVSIGWGFPLIFIIIWAVVKRFVSDNRNCPWLQNDLLDWIYLAPPLLVVLLNLAFLFSIMWVLITKLRSSPAVVEHQQHYKAARALLVLMPLLGVTWVITIYVPSGPTKTKLFESAQTVLLSTQGLMIALFYCFLNTEVQNTIRHHFDNWKARRSLGDHRFRLNSGNRSNGNHRRHTEWTLVQADDIEPPAPNETTHIAAPNHIETPNHTDTAIDVEAQNQKETANHAMK